LDKLAYAVYGKIFSGGPLKANDLISSGRGGEIFFNCKAVASPGPEPPGGYGSAAGSWDRNKINEQGCGPARKGHGNGVIDEKNIRI